MSDLKHYIYVFEAVRPELITNPEAWTEEDKQIASAHFAYLRRATEEGTVILAGRSTDTTGPAVVILDIADEVEARRFMENDPFVAGGLMRRVSAPFPRCAGTGSVMGEILQQHKVIIRQTLAGSNYGILQNETLDLNPDHWKS